MKYTEKHYQEINEHQKKLEKEFNTLKTKASRNFKKESNTQTDYYFLVDNNLYHFKNSSLGYEQGKTIKNANDKMIENIINILKYKEY